jgi:hypothetical protein
MRTFEAIPSAVSAAVEKLVAIEKNRTVPESAVARIAVGSQPLALTTTTVRSACETCAERRSARAASGSRRSATRPMSQSPASDTRLTAGSSTSMATTVPPSIASRAAAMASFPAWPAPSTHTVPPSVGASARVSEPAP